MRILVVDDNQMNLSIVEDYLKQFSNVSEVLFCRLPEDVKTIVDEKSIDILILDIVMPRISGLDLLKMFREDSKYDNMPIIMLTSLNDQSSYQQCYELGAFDYITKPINGIEFKARMKVAIEAKLNSNKLQRLVTVTQEQNDELKEMNARLTEAEFQILQSEKMAAVGQLAAGLAHEINNPMSFVSSNFEFLKKHFLKLSDFLHDMDKGLRLAYDSQNTSREYVYVAIMELVEKYEQLNINYALHELDSILADSEDGIMRVTKIINSLRVFTRSSKDDEKSSFDLLDLIHQVFLISKNEVKYYANIDINIPDDIIIYCNGVQIAQVFVNILVNAAHAIKSQHREEMGTIIVSANKSGQNIVINNNIIGNTKT
ncbi:MAG: response regulator [Clostridiales bacterium]|nr:response regulator [Clostridiales bacterium]